MFFKIWGIARLLSQELQTSGISSKAINETLLAFGIFFTVNAYHTQTGQLSRPVC